MAVTESKGDGYALYNGVKLPNIDSVWTDKETYPYAYSLYSDDYGWLMTLCPEKLWVYQDHLYSVEEQVFLLYTISDGKWVLLNSYGAVDDNKYISTLDAVRNIWCSVDLLYYSENTTYLSATSPIPLDGMTVIEWDGDTTGLTVLTVGTYNLYGVLPELRLTETEMQGSLYSTLVTADEGSTAFSATADTVLVGEDDPDNIVYTTMGTLSGSTAFLAMSRSVSDGGFFLLNISTDIQQNIIFAYTSAEVSADLAPVYAPVNGVWGKQTAYQTQDGKWILISQKEQGSGSIYGVSWDMSSSPVMTRTDAAAGFSAPVPSVGGAAGSSPFDSLMPWAGMQIVEDEYGSWVSIPKFWYKITQTDSAFQIQIADYAADGFSVSPAHADRGDGSGERDTVYIARYKSTIGTAKPVSGAAPMVSITRDYLRTELAKNGVATIQDYAMLWTTRMLMVVEYATWDMQAAIGYNCGNGSSAENTGSTDDMPYHTGTVQAALTTYGVGVQYRYIEDPWGNVAEWVDGWRMDDDGNIYIITNPAEYSDTEGGTLVGAKTSTYGYITGWTVPTAEGFDWALIPQMSGDGSGTKYVADYCYLIGPALGVGGYWDADRFYGPFCLDAGAASNAGTSIGARLQKIP